MDLGLIVAIVDS